MSLLIKTLINSSHQLEKITDITGRYVSWLTLAMVLMTFSIVILRYVFNTGWIAMQEAVTYMHASVFMLAAAYTLQLDAHVRVDIFYQKMSATGKAIINLLGTFLFLLPVCGFILWVSWEYVLNAWEIKESSREAGGLPGVYLLKTQIIIMAILLITQGIAIVLKTIIQLFDVSATHNNHSMEQ